jgi:hypothetical protein
MFHAIVLRCGSVGRYARRPLNWTGASGPEQRRHPSIPLNGLFRERHSPDNHPVRLVGLARKLKPAELHFKR